MTQNTEIFVESLSNLALGPLDISIVPAFTKAAEQGTEPVECIALLGPAGIGKTYGAQEVAKILNVDYQDINIASLPMGNLKSYIEGPPFWYLGYEVGDTLAMQLIKQPKGILVFDEIEKANKASLQYLKHALQKGVVVDSKGRSASLKNLTVVLIGKMSQESFAELMRNEDGTPSSIPYTVVNFKPFGSVPAVQLKNSI